MAVDEAYNRHGCLSTSSFDGFLRVGVPGCDDLGLLPRLEDAIVLDSGYC